jgi:hypothetical protein
MSLRPQTPLALLFWSANMSLSNLHPSVVDDFKTELVRRGRSIEEFDVSATPQHPADASRAFVLSACLGTVTIKDRKSGIERTYETGLGSSWVARFANDLDKHDGEAARKRAAEYRRAWGYESLESRAAPDVLTM